MAVINGIAHSSGGFYPVEIQQSLRFSGGNVYLERTPPVDGNRQKWTFSTWVKRSDTLSTHARRIFNFPTSGFDGFLRFDGFDVDYLRVYDNAVGCDIRTTASFRDLSGWYHIVLAVDTTQATESDRIALYVNNKHITSFSYATYPAQNALIGPNTTVANLVSRSGPEAFEGYMAETYFIDGQALAPTAFGQFKNGVWVPKKYSGSYGTNGFYLDYSDGANIGADRSGNGNNYTPTNLASTDTMLDSPTNNFATLNVNDNPGTILSEGNLKSTANGVGWAGSKSTISIPQSGRWYFETCVFGSTFGVGIASIDSNPSDAFYVGAKVGDYGYHPRYSGSTSKKYTGSSGVDYGVNHADGDIIGILYDADLGEIRFYHNNIDQGAAYTGLTGNFCFAVSEHGTTVDDVNFGQDSSFSNTKTRQGFTDASGRGDFYFQPPAGALALCTANLPEPAFSPLDDRLPSDHFNTVTYTGDSVPVDVTGVGFRSEFTWIKVRNIPSSNWLCDVIRGNAVGLQANGTSAEISTLDIGPIISDDGFQVRLDGTNYTTNGSGNSYVAWNWKAGGAPVTNNAGTVTSTVSANAEAGFSIVSYTGTGANDNVGHGLSKKPEVVLAKSRAVGSWFFFTSVIDGVYRWSRIDLAETFTVAAETLPTDTTFNATAATNNVGANYIAYCFHSVDGFSKIGTYNGNGILNDGTFVYTGFKPAYLMVKRSDDGSNWHVFDNTRDSYNPVDQLLNPNLGDAETVYPDGIDFLSNGFKHLGTGAGLNADGGNYFYMAFAEMPFKYANGR